MKEGQIMVKRILGAACGALVVGLCLAASASAIGTVNRTTYLTFSGGRGAAGRQAGRRHLHLRARQPRAEPQPRARPQQGPQPGSISSRSRTSRPVRWARTATSTSPSVRRDAAKHRRLRPGTRLTSPWAASSSTGSLFDTDCPMWTTRTSQPGPASENARWPLFSCAALNRVITYAFREPDPWPNILPT